MTDTSPYTTEERLIAAVWVHDRALEKRIMTDVLDKFLKRFKKPATKMDILLAWEKKAFASESVLDSPRSGRPASRMGHVEIIQQSVSNFPVGNVGDLVHSTIGFNWNHACSHSAVRWCSCTFCYLGAPVAG
ncbi:hypothetical protein BsWGS_17943 [Bradybaena similaris]